jgi:DNA-binding CsgD family transcriptional regulator
MPDLTPRQLEVARLLARGLSTKAVARTLNISPHTAKVHIQHAAARIPGPGRPQVKLVLYVLQLGEG